MDRWKFYDIIHRRHTVMNPVNENSLEHLYDLLELKRGARVIDIGCGKGEMLIRLAEKYHVEGVRVDKSPYCIREAAKSKRKRVPRADLKFLEMDGAQYDTGNGGSSDLAMCIGATWIYGGFKEKIKGPAGEKKNAGVLFVGGAFFGRKTPPPNPHTPEAF